MLVNKACISCNEPLNGGVYRKPNQCPHCLTIQDPTRGADNKPLVKAKAKPAPQGLAEVISFDKNALPEVEEVAAIDAPAAEVNQPEVIEDTAQEVEQVEVAELVQEEEELTEVAEEEQIEIVAEEEADDILELDDIVPEQEVAESVEASEDEVEEEEVVYYDDDGICDEVENIEVTPDIDESLDIALAIDELEADAEELAVMEHAAVAVAKESVKRPVQEDVAVAETKTAEVVDLSSRVAAREDEFDYEDVVLTTEPAQNVAIERRLDFVTSECVFETNKVKSDAARQEYAASASVLKDARRTVLDDLKKEAFMLGANIVVDVALEYKEISGTDRPMMMVIARGTALKSQAA